MVLSRSKIILEMPLGLRMTWEVYLGILNGDLGNGSWSSGDLSGDVGNGSGSNGDLGNVSGNDLGVPATISSSETYFFSNL